MIRVSAGIVCRDDGTVLLCRRGEGRRNAHLWEFPGGKQEPGETPADCLCRELTEELSLPVTDVSLLCERQEGEISFDFLLCRTEVEPVLTEHEDMVWARPEELGGYDFCPADAPVAWQIALSGVRDCIWDFDGTIADTYPMMNRAMRAAAALQGATPTEEEITALMAVDSKHCCRTLQARYGIDAGRLRSDFRVRQDLVHGCDLMPGVEAVIRETYARGIRHYLLTNRSTRSCEFLQRVGLLELFSGWITEDDGFPAKPDPTGMRALLSRFGLNPARSLMIGDRDLDLAAARGGGTMGLLFCAQPGCACRPCMEAADGFALAELLRGAAAMTEQIGIYLPGIREERTGETSI